VDIWSLAIWAYLAAAIVTLAPALYTLLRGIQLNPSGASFEESTFSPEAKKRLSQHYSRIIGTLGFWKNRAAVYTRFHYYCIVWTILSAWAVPLISAIAPQVEGSPSKWLVVIISSHVALALSFHRGMKVSEGMKAYRLGESEFYDLYRRLLDRPKAFGKSEDEQLEAYFSEVERIRRVVRLSETEAIPDIEGLKPEDAAQRHSGPSTSA
jgi:hypothetical protein